MEDFADQVRDALAHLSDPVHLQTHPLIHLAQNGQPTGRSRTRAAEVLRRDLVGAIESLRPSGTDTRVGRAVRARRGYDVLRLRYVEGLALADIQRELGLSRTLFYAEHNRAVEAVVSLLAERWGVDAQGVGQAEAARAAPREPTGQRVSQPLTSFVGREWELEQILRLLSLPADGGGSRLITLTGPAGIGKTRLALRTGAALEGQRSADVHVIELAALDQCDLVMPAVAHQLGVREQPEKSLFDSVAERLRPSAAILILDNFEQVLGAAPLVGELLRACPGVRAIVTSREPLRVYGERELSVPPLARPAEPTAARPGSAWIRRYESVRLFAERAKAVDAAFDLSEENAAGVAELCRRLDGLPLAIELAAARIRVLSPDQMLSRLEHQLDLLTGGARDLPGRQQTLRGAISWSYELLDTAERSLFTRLSVFAGSFSLGALEAVASAEGGPAATTRAVQSETADRLEALALRSLVQRALSAGGEPRFTLLSVIREYAAERLDAADREPVARAHATHFVQLARMAEPRLFGAEQPLWLEKLEADYENFRGAFRWLVAQRSTDEAQALAGALRQFWMVTGRWREGREWLATALSLEPERQIPARATALHAAAHLAALQNAYDDAERLYGDSLTLHRSLGDASGEALCLYGLGNTALARAEYPRAQALYRDALGLFKELENDERVAATLAQLGIAAEMEGSHEAARALQEESLAVRRRLGDRGGMASTLNNLGNLARGLGDLEAAARYYGESLALCRALGHRLGIGTLSINLALIQIDRAKPAQARALLAESAAIYADLGHARGLAWCLPAAASLAAADGNDDGAAELFGAAAAHLRSTGAILSPAERAAYASREDAVRSRVGSVRFGDAYERGRALTLDEAVERAVSG